MLTLLGLLFLAFVFVIGFLVLIRTGIKLIGAVLLALLLLPFIWVTHPWFEILIILLLAIIIYQKVVDSWNQPNRRFHG